MSHRPRNRIHSLTIVLCLVILGAFYPAIASGTSPQAAAKELLEAAGVEGGLVVHVGCGDGKLTAALRANNRYLVHGLDTNPEQVETARSYIQSLKAYGPVSVDTFDGEHLPYADDMVNLVVVESGKWQVASDEIARVLTPRGIALIGGSLDTRHPSLVTRSPADLRGWTKLIKKVPPEIDEWTHFLHDASNNAVAQDTQVGPPRRLKWVCGPLWSRSHEFKSSLSTMVSANGRVFYIFDEGLTSLTDAPIPEKWTLIARDAFNGLLLWTRSVPKWADRDWRSKSLRGIPPTIQRRLVAAGDRVYVTLGNDAAVSALDAATGKEVSRFEDSEGADEIRWVDGMLILCKGKNMLLAFDAETGKKRWETSGKIQPKSLSAQGSNLVYQDGLSLVCRQIRDGKERWRTPVKSPASLLVIHDDRILLLNKQGLQAVVLESGRNLWTSKTGSGRGELFVANNRVWLYQGEGIVGCDLNTGAVTSKPDTSDVFTPGHHPRCYQSKGTDHFIITPYRGAEFVSVTGAPNVQNDWIRGACRYGVLPCNGLLYVPPNPCFCYPGVKLTGLNALAPARESEIRDQKSGRLEKGPSYENLTSDLRPPSSDRDWPTYRHDIRRSGAATCKVPKNVSALWNVRLPGPLTPPVAAGGRVYVAAKDEHTLYALDAEDGRELWRFTAGGRIDSPPTISGERVIFGCADGRVYCLRASDGEWAWRFRAAPADERIMAFDQLESPWRVHGSVLEKNDTLYFAAGRSTYLDGGIRVFGLDVKTGEVRHETCLDTRARTRVDAENKPFIPAYHIEGALSDILVSEGDYIYLGQYKLDLALNKQAAPYIMPGPEIKSNVMGLTDLQEAPYVSGIGSQKKDEKIQHDWQWRVQKNMMEEYTKKFGGVSMGDRKMGRHVFSTSGFLDDSWFNRTFWMYAETWPGFHIAHLGAKTGQLLVVDENKTYAVQAFPARNLQSPLFTPGRKGYLLFADHNDNEPGVPDYTRGVPKGIGFTRQDPPAWFDWVPVRIRAMVVADKTLFIAGPPDVVDPDDPMAAFEGRKGAVLRAVSADKGNKLAEIMLDSSPVFDGLIAASGKLFMCTTEGEVTCFK